MEVPVLQWSVRGGVRRTCSEQRNGGGLRREGPQSSREKRSLGCTSKETGVRVTTVTTGGEEKERGSSPRMCVVIKLQLCNFRFV